ncbi:MAG: hypothetical protein GXZ07_07210 [Firmicutes bacterium]|nr:hypothetical protein [Bacillota bacterium]
MLLFFLLNVFIAFAAQDINNQALIIEQQRSLLQEKINSLQEYAKMQERVETVEKMLEESIGTEPDWNALLTALAFAVSPEAQLITLSVSYEGDKGELSLQGIAPGHYAVASVMERLNTLHELENVRFNFSAETESQERLGVQFEITAAVLPGEAGGSRKEIP